MMQLITDITKSTMPTSITPPPPPTLPYTLYSPNRDLSRLPPPTTPPAGPAAAIYCCCCLPVLSRAL